MCRHLYFFVRMFLCDCLCVAIGLITAFVWFTLRVCYLYSLLCLIILVHNNVNTHPSALLLSGLDTLQVLAGSSFCCLAEDFQFLVIRLGRLVMLWSCNIMGVSFVAYAICCIYLLSFDVFSEYWIMALWPNHVIPNTCCIYAVWRYFGRWICMGMFTEFVR